jgi:hypothetical protein
MTMTCPACGDTKPCEFEPHREVLNCTECGARIAYGILMPRVTVEPHKDRRFVTVRVETIANGQRATVEHVLDKAFGFACAREIASITAPPKPLIQVVGRQLASDAAHSARAGLGPTPPR